MPPHRGQGGALAIQDAIVLGQRLSKLESLEDLRPLRTTLEGWETELRPLVKQTQSSSVLMCRAQSSWPRPFLALRPLFINTLIRRRSRGLDGLVEVEPAAAPG
jgi:2-polyprenyl-6-methoxyphenol hydroxylase-like FAD-dependent oxidoreductase